MKHLKFLLAILLLSVSSQGQDINFSGKENKESLSKVKDKTIRKEVATFTEAGSKEPKSYIKLKELPLSKFGANYSLFKRDSVSVKLTTGKFVRGARKIKYTAKQAITIDDKPTWGTAGELPQTQINSIDVYIGTDTVMIPRSAYQDLFEPSLAYKEINKKEGGLSVYYSNDKTRYYIAMSNGDGKGAYDVTFIIKNKKYFGRVLDSVTVVQD